MSNAAVQVISTQGGIKSNINSFVADLLINDNTSIPNTADGIFQTITVNENANFNSTVSIDEELIINGDVTLNKNLDVSGNFIIKGINEGIKSNTLYYNLATGEVTYSNITSGASITGDSATRVIYGSETLTIDPSGHDNNTGLVEINGNLSVLGTTTTINSSRVDISGIILLASSATSPEEADGAGILINVNNTDSDKKKFIYKYNQNQTLEYFESNIGLSSETITTNTLRATNIDLSLNALSSELENIDSSLNTLDDKINVITNITPGIAIANKALVIDSSKNIGTIHDISIDGVFAHTNYSFDNNGNLTTDGNITIGANMTEETNADFAYIRGPYIMQIDPRGHDDKSGIVKIMGDLQVDGSTTTIHSSELVIEDKDIILARNADSRPNASGAGIIIGKESDISVSFIYNASSDPGEHAEVDYFQSSIGLSSEIITANRINVNEIKGDVTVIDNGILTVNRVDGDLSGNSSTTTSLNVLNKSSNLNNKQEIDIDATWTDVTNFSETITLKSIESKVNLLFKTSYITSPEAEQYISFRVIRISNATSNEEEVYRDVSLGASFGVSIKNIYIGSFVDEPKDFITNNDDGMTLTYKLQFQLETGGLTINTPYGITEGDTNYNGRYIFLEEKFAK